MNERKINLFDAAVFRTQAIAENTLRIQCEILAHLTTKPFEEIFEVVLKEVDRDTKELITIHSNLGGDTAEN